VKQGGEQGQSLKVDLHQLSPLFDQLKENISVTPLESQAIDLEQEEE